MKKINKHNISNPGFKTPDNYFNSFEENLLSEMKLKNQVSNSGMTTPDDYFKNFKVKIHKDKNLHSESNVVSIFRNQKWLVAASIAAIFIVIMSIPVNQNNALNFASIDSQSIENYLLNNDFDTIELNNLLANSDELESSILEETLNDVHLEEYMYNNIDLEDLNFE